MRSVVFETLRILNESAGYLLLGFLLAGVLHWRVSRSPRFLRVLATRGSKSVFLAALFGLPLPLCSCSVLPTGLALRKKGATNGATVAFLISVPETDIVSILITYGLLGPVMAVFRPLAALITAVVAGLATNLAERWPERSAAAGAETQDQTCCRPGEDYDPTRGALWNIGHYGFVKFFDDIVGMLLFGMVLGGLITALLPAFGVERFAEQPWVAMPAMLAIGIPMYVCASASTPIAAGLIAGGVSPGAALVFLLTGPATNLASLLVLGKHLGRRVLAVYLVCIAVVSVLMGLWLDAFLGSAMASLPPILPVARESGLSPVKLGGSILLLALSYSSFRRTHALDQLVQTVRRRTSLPLSVRGVKAAAGVLLVVGYISSGFFTVGPGERAVVTRFGRMVRSNLPPGLHYHRPYPLERADVVAVSRVRRIELGFRVETEPSTPADLAVHDRAMRGESWMLTGNEDLVDVKWVVQYQVLDSALGEGLIEYLYGIEDPAHLVRGAAEASIRAAVGCRDIDTLLTTQRGEVERTVLESLQGGLERAGAGVGVLAVSLIDVHAPPEVHAAFREVASAAEKKMETIHAAYEYEERVVRQAEGEAARRVAEAEGRAVETVQRARGEGRGFIHRWEVYRDRPTVTRLRIYFESLDAALIKVRKYIRGPSRPEPSLDLWIIQDEARANLPFVPTNGPQSPP